MLSDVKEMCTSSSLFVSRCIGGGNTQNDAMYVDVFINIQLKIVIGCRIITLMIANCTQIISLHQLLLLLRVFHTFDLGMNDLRCMDMKLFTSAQLQYRISKTINFTFIIHSCSLFSLFRMPGKK